MCSKMWRRQKVSHIGVGVTPEEQAIFNAIIKMIGETRWRVKNITVMETVVLKLLQVFQSNTPLNRPLGIVTTIPVTG